MMEEKRDLSRPDEALEILREVGKALTSTLDLDQLLGVIMEMVAKLYEPGNWSLLLVDEEKGELYFTIAVGEKTEKLKGLRLKMGEGIAGWVAEHGETVIINDAYQDPRFARWFDAQSGFKTESVVCVPLVSKGRVLGVIELLNIARVNQSQQHLTMLAALSDFAAIAIENARYVQRIRELSILDDCTTLYNARHMHTLLETEISRAIRYNTPFSVIFLDLDHFKEINDHYGHLVGSRLLGEIGQTIKYSLRTVDWAVRYGGDEFVIILPRASKEDAAQVTRRLQRTLNSTKFFRKEGLNIKVTASFGVATYPDDALNKEDLLRMADHAMYHIKNTTRDGIKLAGAADLHIP